MICIIRIFVFLAPLDLWNGNFRRTVCEIVDKFDRHRYYNFCTRVFGREYADDRCLGLRSFEDVLNHITDREEESSFTVRDLLNNLQDFGDASNRIRTYMRNSSVTI